MEVLGRYSNLRDQGQRIQVLLKMTPDGVPTVRKPKQVHRRLRPHEVEQATLDYHAGATLRDLAGIFRMDRRGVANALERAGVPRRYRRLTASDIDTAIQLYESGKSLLAVGQHLGVNPSTIRHHLLQSKVQLRVQHGRRRQRDEEQPATN